jgi:hypothetical protein
MASESKLKCTVYYWCEVFLVQCDILDIELYQAVIYTYSYESNVSVSHLGVYLFVSAYSVCTEFCVYLNKQFWEEIICLLSLHKSLIWSTWTYFTSTYFTIIQFNLP